MKVLPCGDRAVLLDCASFDEARRWFAASDEFHPILGARSVLLNGTPAELRAFVDRTHPEPMDPRDMGETVEISVVYDGADLNAVAKLTDLTPSEVINAHTTSVWTVGFGGFAPGFFYLVDGDPRLNVPRRESPRTRVPAGSVGLAGEFSGVYPQESPGGWQLIGRTAAPLWDVHRDPPALLRPGQRVKFVPA